MLKSKASKDKDQEVKPVAKKEEVGAPPKPAKTSGARSIVSVRPTRNKAVVKVGDQTFEVVRHRTRKTGVWMIGVPGGGSVTEEDWLAGKGELLP